ncbi:MAG: LacI family DNA-binding transcriptional regulator, partial [Anaerovoracaceae bacterium]
NTAADRLEGYKKALLERNMPINEEYIKIGDYRMQWGIDAVSELIEQKLPIDCIFCGNDIIAIGAVKKLREKGLRVPQDIGVVGFDDIYLAGLTEPALTTVKQPIYEMGYKAAELLINRLRKEPDQDNTVLGKKDTDLNTMILTTELVVRMSTK